MQRLSLSSIAWAALLLAVVGWGVLVIWAPLLGSTRSGDFAARSMPSLATSRPGLLGSATTGRAVGAAVAAVAYVSGSVVCHQRPERSFHLAGAQLPVCGRCTGLYVATAFGVMVASVWTRRRRISSRAWLLGAAVPSLLTLAVEWSGAWPVSNAVRAAAAAPLGLVLGALLVEAAGFRGRL